MATRTISAVGGNWNTAATWAEVAVPTSADDVVATGTSGQLTIDAASACRSIDLTGYTNTLTHNAFTLSVGDASGGALKFVAGMTYTKSSSTSSAIDMVSTSNNGGTGWAITTAGKTFANFSFSGAGGKWVLQDTMNANAAINTTLAFTRGTLDTNNQTITTGVFNTSNGNVRTLTMGSSAISCAQNGIGFEAFNTGSLTVTANTATVTVGSGQSTGSMRGGGKDWNGMSLTILSTTNSTLTNPGILQNVTRTGGAAASNLTLTANLTVNNVFTVTGNNSTTQRLTVLSDVPGTPRTITVNGSVSETNVTYTDITKAGSATWPGPAFIAAPGRLPALVPLMRAATV